MHHIEIAFYVSVGTLAGIILSWMAEQIDSYFSAKHLNAVMKSREESK